MNKGIKEFFLFILTILLPMSNILTGLIVSTNTANNTRIKINEQWKIFLVKEGTHYLEEKDGKLELVKYPPEEKQIIRILPSYNSCINCPSCSPPPPPSLENYTAPVVIQPGETVRFSNNGMVVPPEPE